MAVKITFQRIHILLALGIFAASGASAFAPVLHKPSTFTSFPTRDPKISPNTFSYFGLDEDRLHLKSDVISSASSSSALSGLVSKIIYECIKSRRDDEEEVAQQAPWQIDLETRLEELKTYIAQNSTFADGLLSSIQCAQKLGRENLAPELYEAFLIETPYGWPTSIDAYYRYLTWYASYVPQQSDYDGWLDGSVLDYNSTHQEVYDHLCHFYYLINQRLLSNGVTLQNDVWFSEWIVRYANVWGKFCNGPDSISPKTIQSFYKNSKKFNITDSMIPMNEEDIEVNQYTIYNDQNKPLRPNSPSGWMSWNQMFARELNPGLRPIDSPSKNQVICSPADCTYKATYPINADNILVDNDIVQNDRIKRTHNIGNIAELLEGSEYADAFAGGTYVHYFLGPYSYHRFHTPVAGVIKESFPKKGLAYLDVRIDNTGQFAADDDSSNGYEFAQARGILTIDTTDSPYGNVGIVAVIPIGMCQVSSVSMIATPGARVEKGEEFGYFQFGGSDIIMLFQKDAVKDIIRNETAYNHYGMQVVTGN